MTIEWLTPWRPITDPELGRAYEDELGREVGPGHPLAGLPVVAIAQNGGNDDVLFELRDGTGRYAEVHLTWAGRAELPPWPVTALFDGRDDWVERGMRVDHADETSLGTTFGE